MISDFAGLFAGDGVLDVLLVIHVGRGVTNEEDDLQHILAFAPFHLVHRLVKGLVHRLGRVAAALRLESGELGVNVVYVFTKGIGLGDIGVRLVTIADEADLDLWGGFAGNHHVGHRPDLLLGPCDEAAHGAGGIEHEADFNAGFLCVLSGFGRFLVIGKRRRSEE